MLKTILISILALLAVPPALAAKQPAAQANNQVTPQVTVAQLTSILSSSHKERDSNFAQRLYSLQLTERLSPANLTALNAQLPGEKSRQALDLLAAQSVFLPPPPSEIPHRPPPSVHQQQVIINKALSYVIATLHNLPNFFARIKIMRYRTAPPILLLNGNTGGHLRFGGIQKVNQFTATVLYQNGREVIQKNGKNRNRIAPSASFMTSYGEFGNIFTLVFGDLPKGKIAWSRWTRWTQSTHKTHGPSATAAVFHYSVPKSVSHDVVGYCCVNGQPTKEIHGYHGELTIDPSTGTVLRLTIVTDVTPDAPLTTWSMMVQYAPVTLGGKPYYCPVSSVSLYRAPLDDAVPEAYLHQGFVPSKAPSPGPRMETQLNQTTYSHYHLFRADVHLHPQDVVKPPAKPSNKPEQPQNPSKPQNPSR